MYFLCFLPLLIIGFSVLITVIMLKRGLNRRFVICSQGVFAMLGMIILPLFLFIFTSRIKAEPSQISFRTVSEAEASSRSISYGLGLIAAAIALGIGAIGGGLAVASAVPAAIASLTENPDNFGKLLVLIILGEAIAIYGLAISVIIIGKLDVLLIAGG